ncbi:cyclase [Bacillus sp. SORGH_AS 510]|uniref:MBL fold metallo-hydrolase n=1 Tax=Bacillus sp. SORGH_AS_0510 TaxID=3041771 RepID=UPI0027860B35|nr:MBL fold metallo-hydrolase [Bacillus sp. SORGH_AS_0510]MDQ1147845.1 cyclase [Bacillus sp. SORGH_AS_0510]
MINQFFSKHFTLETVQDGVYAAIAKEGGGAVGNAGFVDLGGQTLVFDTFNTQQAAEDLKTLAIRVTNQPITWVVNSHWHGDHVRGNQVFKESTIVSSQATFEKMKELHPARIEKQKGDIQGLINYIQTLKLKLGEEYDKELEQQINFLSEMEVSLPTLELVLPQQTFKSEMSFKGSKRSARLFTLGGGHSYCDAILYIPEEKVAFMGDLLFVDTAPTIFEESNPQKWIEILRKVEEMDIEVAIPGHGPVGTKGNFQQVIEYIEKR